MQNIEGLDRTMEENTILFGLLKSFFVFGVEILAKTIQNDSNTCF